MIDASSPFIYAALACLAIFGGAIGIMISFAWLAVGAWFVSRSRSRGLYADAAFAVTWPIWLIVEGH